MSGLAAGIRLSYYDKKILIVEKHFLPGGLNSYYKRKGRIFDVGLHAVTNTFKGKNKQAPMSKLLRQLKIKKEELNLSPQLNSKIHFKNKTLNFSNNFDTLKNEINLNFPDDSKGFEDLNDYILNYNEVSLESVYSSSRSVLSEYIKSPLLIDMLLCPLMYYGSAYEHDMDFSQFAIMFKSIYLEGFSRPKEGVKGIIDKLINKLHDQGGELRYKSGVKRIINKNAKASGVELESGEIITCDQIFSSAGIYETKKLIKECSVFPEQGQLSFVEMIFILDKSPKELGLKDTIIFFNKTDEFCYRKPEKIVDINSGVLCCPNNFDYETELDDGIIRLTYMANYDLWNSLSKEDYKKEKENYMNKAMEQIEVFAPEFRKHIVETDMFTPLTVKKFTGHANGAVYGSPEKIRDGKTELENLYIIGTDQGFLGIIGSMLSGISIANLYGLMKSN